MARHRNYLEEINASESGPHIAALFDFDGTIIAGYSAMALLQEKFKRREMGLEEIIETANVMSQYNMGSIGFSGLMTAAAKFMKGVTEESFREFGEELYQKHIAKKVYPESREIIRAHQAKGHTVAIVSSATIYQIEPTARDLDIEHILCSEYEIENGEFTGEIIRPLCFGEGKVISAESLAERFGCDLDNSYFYSDSSDDIELLERVGKPRVLNPNTKLRNIARQRDWPVQEFGSRGTPSILDYTRTIYATSSLVGAFAAGLPIWALTRSQREAMNFSMGLFGDFAAAMVGMDLDVYGERNLWAARPCVFVFNHQSKADVVILAKLIRKDMGGVGKQEIKNIPILGQIMEWAGTVFIDRKNSSDAIKAMEPLVDAIQKDGKSICIAPEGTRTLSPKLGPFKKGAFHLAMQAGVPIVPIVIHNAGDVAPKNEFVMRPATVRVDVLPPVDTSGWSAKTMNLHVAEGRNLFLKALGQPEEAPEPAREKAKAAKETPAPKKAKASVAKAKAQPKVKPKAPPKKPATAKGKGR
ncbi:HAD-IB family hydrolase [Sphingorhabdus sp.]|uniref:HAD-IB family hydrolase n=1 Tax=Sphingorhabdus sp. TaxID=1902408 RepID=UPI003BB066D4